MKRIVASSWLLAVSIPVSTSSRLPLILVAILLGFGFAWLPLPWAVAVVGGTAVFLLLIIQPLVGLGLALLLGPLGALENILLGGSSLDSGQIILLLTLAVWLGRGLSRRQIRIPRTFLNIPLLLYLLVVGLTLPNAPSLAFGVKEWLKWIEITLIMWLVVDEGRRKLEVRSKKLEVSNGKSEVRRWKLAGGRPKITDWVLVMLLLAGLSQAMIGIWQFRLRGTGPEHFAVLGGRFYRAYGSFEQPNPFGGFMNLTALLALGTFIGLLVRWLATVRRSQVVENQRSEGEYISPFHPFTLSPLLIAGGVAVMTSLALVFSWSRGAWLGFGAGTAVLLFFWPTRQRYGLVFVGLVAIALFLAWQMNLVPPSIAGRITGFRQDWQLGDVRGVDINDANYAVVERLAHWQAAVAMARENLWLGVGFGNYEPAYADYALINWPAPLGHAHNYYLNVLAETGILGLGAYLFLWTAVFWQTIRLLRRLDWPRRGIALGLLAAWSALTIHHLVDKLYVNNVYIHLGVMFGLLQLLDQPAGQLTQEAPNESTSIQLQTEGYYL